MAIRRRLLGALTLPLVLVSCLDDAPGRSDAPSTTSIRTLDDVADTFACTEIESGESEAIGPLRGTATRGVRCTIRGSHVHIFERAPGVSMDRIDVVLEIGVATPG